MNDFMYGDYGICPLAVAFFKGEYHCFIRFEGKKGVYLAKSNDLLSFFGTTLVLADEVYGQPSVYEKNDKLYFFYSTKKGDIKHTSIDRNGNVFTNPIPIISRKKIFDPKVSFYEGKFFLLAVSLKNEVLLFSSDNMIDFSFMTQFKLPEKGKICCPSLHKASEKYILFFNKENSLYYYNASLGDQFILEGSAIYLEAIDFCRIAQLGDGRTILSGCIKGKLVFREVWIKEGQVHLYPLMEIRNRREYIKGIECKEISYEEIEHEQFRNFSLSISTKPDPQLSKQIRLSFGNKPLSQLYLYIDRERDFVVLGGGAQSRIYKVEGKGESINEIEIYVHDLLMEIVFIKEGFILSAENPFLSSKTSLFSFCFTEKTNCIMQLYLNAYVP